MTVHATSEPPCLIESVELSYGEHLLVWALRRRVARRGFCPLLVREFERACGADAPAALEALQRFIVTLALSGRRRLRIGHPGCGGVTRDERNLLTVIAAAQAGAIDRANAQLRWLAAGWARHDLLHAALRLGETLDGHGHRLVLPPPSAQRGHGLHPALVVVPPSEDARTA